MGEWSAESATDERLLNERVKVMLSSLGDMRNVSVSVSVGVSRRVEGGFLSGRNPFTFDADFPLPTFIVQLLVIIGMSRAVKVGLSPIRQPAVMAEIISGIILGPSVLGHVPAFTAAVFPQASLPFLGLMSNFGLVLFLFLVGLELDPRMLRKSLRQSLGISLAGMMLPFVLGVGTSFALYTLVEPPDHSASFTTYFLFLGVAMAITAFPVLARILTELNLLKTKVGSITVSAAAVDDATSWCLLALVISLIKADSGLIALYVFLIGLSYSLFLILCVRPVYKWMLRRSGAFDAEPTQLVMFLTLSLVFVSAFITDAIGIHAIFGGFLAGIVMPHDGGFAYHVTHKLEDIVSVLFLPLYFALSGLRTQIGALDDGISWAMVLLVICVACFGKICACTLAARFGSMTWRESITVGVLMNCKGLVELIVLNLGYDAKVISERTFAIMVIMALVTTFLTVPAVTYIYPPRFHDERHADREAEHSKAQHHNDRPPPSKQPSILVSVNKIEHVPSILSIINIIDSHYTRSLTHTRHPRTPDATDHFSKAPAHAGPPYKKLLVNALRLIEITERDSSVMLQTSQDALSNDPVMKMLRAFCEITGVPVHALIKVVTISNFAETLNSTAAEVDARFVVVPWMGSGCLAGEEKASPVQQVFRESRRAQAMHTSVQHSNFILELLSSATAAVLLLVDRGLELNPSNAGPSSLQGLVPHFKHIFLPFFGGPDDRQALDICLGIAGHQGLKVSVVRFKGTQPSNNHFAESELGSAASETDTMPPPEFFVMDTTDDVVLKRAFGYETLLLHEPNPSLVYSEVDSVAPVLTALHFVKELSASDLVVLGRGSTVKLSFYNGLSLKAADAERRKVLGDVAEAILLGPSQASLLVVQSSDADRRVV